jgi:hypothetical protein
MMARRFRFVTLLATASSLPEFDHRDDFLGGNPETVRIPLLARQAARRRPSGTGIMPGRPGSPLCRVPAERGPCRRRSWRQKRRFGASHDSARRLILR